MNTKWVESWIVALQKLNPRGRFCVVSAESIGYMGDPKAIHCPKGFTLEKKCGAERRFYPDGPELIRVDPTWCIRA